MRSELFTRIKRLEGMPVTAITKLSQEDEAALIAKLKADMLELLADDTEQERIAALDTDGRIRHFQAEIEDVERQLTDAADEIHARLLDLRRMTARTALRGAQIDRLRELGYDAERLSAQDELPEDAIRLLEGCQSKLVPTQREADADVF